jgi:hypothetical protein
MEGYSAKLEFRIGWSSVHLLVECFLLVYLVKIISNEDVVLIATVDYIDAKWFSFFMNIRR